VIGDVVTPTLNTTPESYELHQAFAQMVEAGCEYAVMEVSSQGIKMHRTDGLYFNYAIFTNISPDHIGPGEHADFEEYLYENSYRVVKIFLNVSRKKQKQRFLERIDVPEKNWKFSQSDMAERALWDQYDDAYECAVNATATKENPWYVIPADQKWYSRYLVSEIILDVLQKIDPQYPTLSQEEAEKLPQYKEMLQNENMKHS